MRKAVFVADIHYPYQDNKVFQIIKQILYDEQPDYLVFLGDCFNADGISKFYINDHEDGFFQTIREIKNFRKEYFLPLVQCAKNAQVLWTLGNHDGKRIEEFLEKTRLKCHPDKYQDFKTKIDLTKIFPKVSFKKYNECHKIGKLYLTHGEFHSKGHAEKHVTVYGKSILYGHLHTHDAKTVNTKANNKVHTGYSMPCACKLDIPYMSKHSSSWVQGLSVGYFRNNGEFNLYMINIINGKCIWNGKMYGS